ncbi:ABZJ_00895 family protein [Ruegeria faecimaris]|uniref:ABZJ_00895 family protein n=1 Tax=Ruegeria faecimaris TaxID=686389 RepID=UPI002493890A|nr:ABZJ_00895 family protein [Ruegeria faecimaris]
MKKTNLALYTVLLFGIRMAFPALAILIAMFLNYEIGSSGISIIAPMIAAMIVGQQYGNRYGELIPQSEVTRFARRAIFVAIAAEAITSLVWGYLLMGAEFIQFLSSVAQADGKILMVAVILFLFVLTYFVNRWCVQMGAKGALKSRLRKTQLGK